MASPEQKAKSAARRRRAAASSLESRRVVTPPLFEEREKPWLPTRGPRRDEGERVVAPPGGVTTSAPGTVGPPATVADDGIGSLDSSGLSRPVDLVGGSRGKGSKPVAVDEGYRDDPLIGKPLDEPDEAECACICRCVAPDDLGDTLPDVIKNRAITPPVFAPTILDPTTGPSPYAGAVEAQTDVIAREDVALGATDLVTVANVRSQRASTPTGRAKSPPGIAYTEQMGWSGGGTREKPILHPPTTGVTAAASPGESPVATPLVFPLGVFVNPRPTGMGGQMASGPSMPSSMSSASGSSGGIDRGAGEGAFVNVRPGYGFDDLDEESSPPIPVASVGAASVGSASGDGGPIIPDLPPDVIPPCPPCVEPRPPEGDTRGRGPGVDEQDGMALTPPGIKTHQYRRGTGRTSAKASRPFATRPHYRTIGPPLAPSPSRFVLTPGGTFSSLASIRSNVAILDGAGASMGPVGRRGGARRAIPPVSPPQALPLTPKGFDLVDGATVRTPTSEQDSVGLRRIDPNAKPTAQRVATTIDQSIGASPRPPTFTATPPSHPALVSQGSAPALAPANTHPIVEAPPPVRRRVILSMSSAAGVGSAVATSTFTAVVPSKTALAPSGASTTASSAAGSATAYAPEVSAPLLRSIVLTRQPSGSSATSPPSSTATRPTVAPQDGPNGSAVTSKLTKAPITLAGQLTKGAGGKNADGRIEAAGEAIVEARAAATAAQAVDYAQVQRELVGLSSKIAEKQVAIDRLTARPPADDKDASMKRAVEVANLTIERSSLEDAAGKLTVALDSAHALGMESVAAEERAKVAIATARAGDPTISDARLQDAADHAAKRRAKTAFGIPTATKIANSYAGKRATLEAQADEAKQDRRQFDKEATRNRERLSDRAFATWKGKNESRDRRLDLRRAARLDGDAWKDDKLRAKRDDPTTRLTPEERGELRALEATRVARRIERDQIAKREKARLEKMKARWAKEDADSAKANDELSTDDYNAWQARQDAAAEADESDLRDALEAKDGAAQHGKGPPLNAAEAAALKELKKRKGARDARAAAPQVMDSAGCPNCPAPPSCPPPAQWVCTPPPDPTPKPDNGRSYEKPEGSPPDPSPPPGDKSGPGSAPILPIGSGAGIAGPKVGGERPPNDVRPEDADESEQAAADRLRSDAAAKRKTAEALATLDQNIDEILDRLLGAEPPRLSIHEALWDLNHEARENLRAAIRIEQLAELRVADLEAELGEFSTLGMQTEWELVHGKGPTDRPAALARSARLRSIRDALVATQKEIQTELAEAEKAVRVAATEVARLVAPARARVGWLKKDADYAGRNPAELLASGLIDMVGSAVTTALNVVLASLSLPTLTWRNRLPDASASNAGAIFGRAIGEAASAVVVGKVLEYGMAGLRAFVGAMRKTGNSVVEALHAAKRGAKAAEEARTFAAVPKPKKPPPSSPPDAPSAGPTSRSSTAGGSPPVRPGTTNPTGPKPVGPPEPHAPVKSATVEPPAGRAPTSSAKVETSKPGESGAMTKDAEPGHFEGGNVAERPASPQPAVALDTSAHHFLYPRTTTNPEWTKNAREVLSGRDLRVPEGMIDEIVTKTGTTRAQVLDDLSKFGRSVEVIPEGSAATRAALDKVASKKVKEFDRRIGASAADFGEQLATGDRRQAEALIRSGLMTREQIISLTPPGLRPGEGWSNSTIAALVAIALAATSTDDSR